MTLAPFLTRYWMVGRLARMRVSSVIWPVALSCGTFRSARTNTALPLRSASDRSETLRLRPMMPCSAPGWGMHGSCGARVATCWQSVGRAPARRPWSTPMNPDSTTISDGGHPEHAVRACLINPLLHRGTATYSSETGEGRAKPAIPTHAIDLPGPATSHSHVHAHSRL